jgi:glutathione S-transferase
MNANSKVPVLVDGDFALAWFARVQDLPAWQSTTPAW